MTLSKGDHVVIKRNGKILTENDEAYHEFEVLCYPTYLTLDDGEVVNVVALKVVK